jgi:hypothetical protein
MISFQRRESQLIPEDKKINLTQCLRNRTHADSLVAISPLQRRQSQLNT